MHMATPLDSAARAELTTRLRSIEGQARGIERMLDEGRDCQEIMDQLTALRAAAHAVTMQALEGFAAHCLAETPDRPDQVLSQMLGIVARLTR
jgi:CsoR family transcriptional regulator, copper-sensing transcriptional repressor